MQLACNTAEASAPAERLRTAPLHPHRHHTPPPPSLSRRWEAVTLTVFLGRLQCSHQEHHTIPQIRRSAISYESSRASGRNRSFLIFMVCSSPVNGAVRARLRSRNMFSVDPGATQCAEESRLLYTTRCSLLDTQWCPGQNLQHVISRHSVSVSTPLFPTHQTAIEGGRCLLRGTTTDDETCTKLSSPTVNECFRLFASGYMSGLCSKVATESGASDRVRGGSGGGRRGGGRGEGKAAGEAVPPRDGENELATLPSTTGLSSAEEQVGTRRKEMQDLRASMRTAH